MVGAGGGSGAFGLALAPAPRAHRRPHVSALLGDDYMFTDELNKIQSDVDYINLEELHEKQVIAQSDGEMMYDEWLEQCTELYSH